MGIFKWLSEVVKLEEGGEVKTKTKPKFIPKETYDPKFKWVLKEKSYGMSSYYLLDPVLVTTGRWKIIHKILKRSYDHTYESCRLELEVYRKGEKKPIWIDEEYLDVDAEPIEVVFNCEGFNNV